jgi:thioredoxin-related protein
MRRRIHIYLASAVFFSAFALSSGRLIAADDWFVEFEPAQAEAKKEQKDLLIDFGGSDWCYPCKMLKERILSKPKFIELARENFVLVDIDDLHRGEMPAGRKQRYQALQKVYGVETFPSVVLATPEGKPYAWATYVPSVNEPDEYWNFLEPLRQRGVTFRKHLQRAGDASGGERAAALVDAMSAIRADFVAEYYASEVREIRKLDPDDRSGYLAFFQARHDVEALQARLHEAKANAAAIDESPAERAELDGVSQAVDNLIDGGRLRGEALQEALLLRAVLQVHAHEPGKALESLEALLAAQSTRTRFDQGDFLPLDATSLKRVAERIATAKRAPDDRLRQYFALHRIFEFELPDRYELSCGHGFRPAWLARGWIGEEYGRLLIGSTADLPPAERARVLRKGLENTNFWRQGSLAEIQDRLLPQLEGKPGKREK